MIDDYYYGYSGVWWRIIERRTGNIMGVYKKEDDCVIATLALMKSSTFDGWTPSFVLVDVKPQLNRLVGERDAS